MYKHVVIYLQFDSHVEVIKLQINNSRANNSHRNKIIVLHPSYS